LLLKRDISSYLGLKRGDVIINVDNGKSKQIVQGILQSYRHTNVLSVSTGAQSIPNNVLQRLYLSISNGLYLLSL
jgi:hypothetical protein